MNNSVRVSVRTMFQGKGVLSGFPWDLARAVLKSTTNTRRRTCPGTTTPCARPSADPTSTRPTISPAKADSSRQRAALYNHSRVLSSTVNDSIAMLYARRYTPTSPGNAQHYRRFDTDIISPFWSVTTGHRRRSSTYTHRFSSVRSSRVKFWVHGLNPRKLPTD